MKKQGTRVSVRCLVLFLILSSLCLCASVVRSEPPFYPDKSKLVVRDADGKEHPVRNAEDWVKRLIAGKYELKPEKVPFDFPEVVAALAPRAFLASSPLHDDNFEVSGVRDCIAAARPVYELLDTKDKLAANYPNCKHDFPPKVRKVAYEWLDRWLK